jgi:signal transduction histidine kinase
MRAGLTTRLLFATGVLALIIAAAFAALLIAMADVSRVRATFGNSMQEINAARDVNKGLTEMETSQRGFILTADQSFLEPWDADVRELPRRIAALRAIVDDPGQARRAEQLERDTLAYINDYSVPLVEAARRGDPSARSLAVSEDGKRRMEVLRRELDTYLSTEWSLSAAEQAEADHGYRRATGFAVGGLGFSLLFTALVTTYLARGVLGPVRRTATMAGRLAAGDLGARVPESSQAEIGVLERSFNSMAESLEHGRDELARLNEDQAALRRVATLVARGTPSDEVFAAVTKEVGLLQGAEITRLLRFEADGSATVAAAWSRTGDALPVGSRIAIDSIVAAPVRESGKPARITEQSPPELPGGSYSAVGAPIMVAGTIWGAMTALSSRDRALPEGAEARVAEFTDLVGTAIANAQARADLVASRARIVAAADESRRRIERDLHDGIQQRLVTLALQLRVLEADLPAVAPELSSQLTVLGTGLVEAVDELREISRGIHPAVLSEGGMVPALKALGRRSVIPVDFDLRVQNRLPPSIEAAAYYVVAEAVTNAMKHANASVVRVAATVGDFRLFLTIRDDGAGGADVSRGSGLIGLTDRVEALGGTLTLVSAPGQGTSVQAELPLSGQESKTGVSDG